MSVKLFFDNLNTLPVTVNVYRSEQPLDRGNLTAPIATLTGGEKVFEDLTVEYGKTYYYVFETVYKNARVSTVNQKVEARSRMGHGPNQLTLGNYRLGYFGSIPSAEFITGSKLCRLVNLTSGALLNDALIWHKFVRNNKIYLLPQGAVRRTVNLSQLDAVGLIDGAQIQVGRDTYLVRNMSMYNDEHVPGEAIANGYHLSPYRNEFDDFVLPLHSVITANQRLPNIAKLTISALTITSAVLGRERTGANLLTRWGTGDSATNLHTLTNISSGTTTAVWWPVLELIDGVE